jgi:hypothetical protein
MHLLTSCPFARTIWHEVLSWIQWTSTPWLPETTPLPCGLWRCMPPRVPVQGHLVNDPAHGVVDLEASQCTVFDNTRPSVASLLDMIKTEARAWAEAGARGVRELLP